jgi:signal transduction histidine kinase
MEMLHVLHIEDDPNDALLIERELRKGWSQISIVRIETAVDLEKALETPVWDIILSDHALPTLDAIQALEIVGRRGCDIPFIIVSGGVREDLVAEAMHEGAHDCVLKDRLTRLIPAVDREVTSARLRAKHRESEQLLKNQEQQLILADRLASVGQLAAGIAHEVNNPLGYVMSNLETLASYLESVEGSWMRVKALAEAARRSGNAALQRLADDFETYGREKKLPFIFEDLPNVVAESREGASRIRDIVGHLKIFVRCDEKELKRYDINDAVETALKLAWHELKYKCRVEKKLREIPSVKCHPGQIVQVFMNLFVNAAHAILDFGRVDVETELCDSLVRITVKDTGRGIAPEHLKKLFTPFFTTKPIGTGTGLGLSVSLGIINNHGGHIEVESSFGKGTMFRVYLPVAR